MTNNNKVNFYYQTPKKKMNRPTKKKNKHLKKKKSPLNQNKTKYKKIINHTSIENNDTYLYCKLVLTNYLIRILLISSSPPVIPRR